MSFGFLPVPIYIAMVLSISVVLFIYTIKYYKAGKNILSITCILAFIISLLVAIAKTIQEYFREYEQYVSILIIVGGILFFIELIFLGIAGWQNAKKNPEKRKFSIFFWL